MTHDNFNLAALDLDDDLPTTPKLPIEVMEMIGNGLSAFAHASAMYAKAKPSEAPVVASVVAPAASTGPKPVGATALTRRYRWLNDRGVQLGSMSTDEMMLAVLPQMRYLVAQLVVTAENTTDQAVKHEYGLRARELASMMRRVPAAREDGKVYVTDPEGQREVADLEALAKTFGVDAATWSDDPVAPRADKAEKIAPVVPARPKEIVRYIALGEEAEDSGKLVDWDLSGEMLIGSLRPAWVAEGLDEDWLPSVSRPATILHRAAQELENRHVRVMKNQSVGGWEVVRVQPGERFNALSTPVRLFIDEDTGEIGCEAGPGQTQEEADALAETVRTEYRRQMDLEVLKAPQVGSWLVKLTLQGLGGFSYRPRKGGVYYVPANRKPALKAIARALRACSSHIVHDEVDMVRSVGLASKAIDALADELAKAKEEIESSIAVGEMGQRKALNRIDDLDELADRIGKYEGLFGIDMQAAKQTISVLRKTLEALQTRTSQIETD